MFLFEKTYERVNCATFIYYTIVVSKSLLYETTSVPIVYGPAPESRCRWTLRPLEK